MVNSSVLRIEHQIARLRLRQADLGSRSALRRGSSRQGHAIVFENALYKAGAVRSVGQTGAAPDIGITQKLFRKIDQIHAHIGHALTVDQLRLRHRTVKLLRNIHIIRGNIGFLIIQHDLHPAVQLLHDFQLFAFRHKSDDRTLRAGLLAHTKTAGVADRHVGGNLIRPVSRFLSGQEKFRLHIAGHLSGFNIGPPVLNLIDLTAAVFAHLADQLAIFGGFLSHIQIIGYVGDAKIAEAVNCFPLILRFLSCSQIIFLSQISLQNLSHARGRHGRRPARQNRLRPSEAERCTYHQ